MSGRLLIDIIHPPTEAENFSGKAYTIREGESLIEWLQRGVREHGEAREKFRKTVFGNVRMAMRAHATGNPLGNFKGSGEGHSSSRT